MYLSQSSLIVWILRVHNRLLCLLNQVGRLVHDVSCMVNNRVLEVTVGAGCSHTTHGTRQHTQCVCRVTGRYPSVVLITLQYITVQVKGTNKGLKV